MINLKNKKTEKIKSIPTGFSVTTFLFGPMVPLARGDFKFLFWGFIGLPFIFIILPLMLELSGYFFIGGIVVYIIYWIILPFRYNNIYIKALLKKGFVPADETSENYLISQGIKNEN